ncbi:MAG: HD domain-containing protein [Eubacterium sp.]|nr:HD domain-containing protein [Eubacterium sp.]
MIVTYYAVTLGISLALTLAYVFIWHRHFDVHFTLMFTFIPISNLGFLLLAISTNLSEAVIANDITYLGGCFLMLFIMMCILDQCNMKLPKATRVSFFLITFAIYASVLTAGWMPYFYTTLDFKQENGAGTLIKSYGFMHTLFYVMLGVYFLISIWALVYSYKKKNDVSNRTIALMAIPEGISLLAYTVGKMIPFSVNLVPVSYLFAQLFFLLIVNKTCLYDVSETHLDSLNQAGETGFLSFDFKFHFLGGNDAVKNFFPELKEVKVDSPSEETPFLAEQAMNRLLSFIENEENDTSFYSRDGHTYIFDVDYLYDGKKKRGYRIFITDDTKNQEYIAMVNRFNTKLQEEVEEKTAHIAEMHDNLILSLATMVESRDNSTGGHIKRTSAGVRILVDEIMKTNRLHLTREFRRAIIKAAPMHDLGKIAVPDAILQKPGRFEDWEYEKMKAHAAEGGRIVHQVLEGTDDEYFRKIAENVATYHHERWDGSGYPKGLKGLEIPLEARIMAIADVYDALVSKRVYKESMSFEQADRIIMEGMGTQFDKKLEPYYVAARPKLEKYYSSLSE